VAACSSGAAGRSPFLRELLAAPPGQERAIERWG
jgi:hypothetical protein